MPGLRAAQPRPNGYTEEERATILRAYQERSSLRGLTRTFGVARTPWPLGSKKARALPPLADTPVPPPDGAAPVPGLDELGSLVQSRLWPAWVWLAVRRQARQGVAWALGDRSEDTCRELWDAVPEVFRQATCYMDLWLAHQAVVPDGQHRAVGKETGQTAYVERLNSTLRQRLARSTLSFSQCDLRHGRCVELFLHDYNLERASTLE